MRRSAASRRQRRWRCRACTRCSRSMISRRSCASAACCAIPIPARRSTRPGRSRSPTAKSRYVGEPVALVIADDRYIAEDAAALVEVDYDVLPTVGDCRTAVGPGAPLVRRELGSNIVTSYQCRFGDADAAFRQAAHVFREELWQHRGSGHPIETRGLLADYRGADESITVWASTQKAHDLFQSSHRGARGRRDAAAGGLARYRRRLRSQALRLFRGCRRGGGSRAAAALDQMDRGPARAFHQCRAGARPALVAGDRRRRARRACSACAGAFCTTRAPMRCRTPTFPTIPRPR